MKLYLVQHGKAKSKDEDPQRPLTEAGRQETEKMAALAARMGVEVHQIRHSGKTRAAQTAAIFQEQLDPPSGLQAVDGLNPTDEVEPVAEHLKAAGETVMLVGHLPFMPGLAGWLVNRDPQAPPVPFRNSGILCLQLKEGEWSVDWHLTPG